MERSSRDFSSFVERSEIEEKSGQGVHNYCCILFGNFLRSKHDREKTWYYFLPGGHPKIDYDPELKNISTAKFKELTHGSEIYEALQTSNDIEFLASVMTTRQKVEVEKHKDKLQRQRLNEYR